ncbi:hypothetical protein A2892_00955 [Candidatus Woesebacteria bacterium RIFCSPLOWO2_01_FULL_39_10b]|uniref:Uncharacterized protein n=1 Tax=Candidatus Woesebacteria bacterium RIFCSPLOWO2_01_FULL_39_10b TaxID=1802517 RepID=A0A1F8BA96_9BACT|nr:MAG: hypothetical protein A2892_00955 [Candidatus Woesebacteria bacterium RIFCSPLOWO2_01_FULL_39_10b]
MSKKLFKIILIVVFLISLFVGSIKTELKQDIRVILLVMAGYLFFLYRLKPRQNYLILFQILLLSLYPLLWFSFPDKNLYWYGLLMFINLFFIVLNYLSF